MVDDGHTGCLPQRGARPILAERPLKLDIDRLTVTDEDRNPHAGGGDRDVWVEYLAGLGRHFPFFLGRAVVHKDVAMGDDIEGYLLGKVLGLHRVVHVDRARLVEQFVHRGAARPGNGLVGRYHNALDPSEIMQRLQRDDQLDRRAVRIGDNPAFRVLGDGLRVDLRHDQRDVGLHAEARGVVDDHGARLRRTRREDIGHLGAGRGEDDIDTTEVIGVEALDLENVVLAERNLTADRA